MLLPVSPLVLVLLAGPIAASPEEPPSLGDDVHEHTPPNLEEWSDAPDMNASQGATYGLLTGVWAALAFMIVWLFEQRKWGYMLINAGYMLVAFTLKGLIIGAWR